MADELPDSALIYRPARHGKGPELHLTRKFWDDHWERRPLLVERADDTAFRDVFDPLRFEELLEFGALRKGFVTVVHNGDNVPAAAYCRSMEIGGFTQDDLADPEAVAAYRARGATVILAAVHLYCRPAGRFAAFLTDATGREIEAHAFHTPARTGGLAPHFDGEDNFLLQLDGTKHWTLHPPLTARLPVEGGRPPVGHRPDPGSAVHCALRPGDLLYIPRGWLHSSTTGEEASLHITFQLLPSLLSTAVMERLEARLQALGLLDATLPGQGRPVPAEVVAGIRALSGHLDEWADQLKGR